MVIDKILCAGKNYWDHIQEMDGTPVEKPVIFIKPPSVLRQATRWQEKLSLDFPVGRGDLHHECEIVLRLGKGGYQMSLDEANEAISHVTVGLDMTLRSLQNELRKAGQPWTIAKVFKDSAVIGPWIAKADFEDFLSTEFILSIDGVERQRGLGSKMLMDPYSFIVYASHCIPLCEGDIVFMGTPAGVGPVQQGSHAILTWADNSYQVTWR